MQALFSPAVAVMNRLSYSRKFVVLGLLSWLAVLVVIINLYLSLHQVIANAQTQLNGLTQIKALTQSIQLMQQHRGLTSGVIGGVESLRDKQVDREQQVSQSLSSIETNLPSIENRLKDIKNQWLMIEQNGASFGIETSFNAHNQSIAQLFEIKELLSDLALLSVDPSLDTHHLIMLITEDFQEILEDIGQLQAYTLGFMAKNPITPEQTRQLMFLENQMKKSLARINTNLEHTTGYNPDLKPFVNITADSLEIAVSIVSQAVLPDILSKRFAIDPENFYTVMTQLLNTVYLQIYDHYIPATEKLINQRITHAQQTLWLSISIPAGLFSIIIYLAIGGFISVTRSIRDLTHATKACIGGNLSLRLPITSQDEIGHMMTSFNQLADSFEALLEQQGYDQMRVQKIIETALDAILQVDAHGILLNWNQQAEQIFGWSIHEIRGHFLLDIVIPERFRKTYRRGLEQYRKTGDSIILGQRIEMTALHRDGHEFPIEISITPIQLKHNIELSVFIRDISESKRAKTALITSEARTRAVLRTMSDVVILIDAQGSVLLVNDAIDDIFGYKEEELLGQNVKMLMPEPYYSNHDGYLKNHAEHHSRVILGRRVEVTGQCKDGHTIPIELSVNELIDDQGNTYLGVIRDITERKTTELARENAHLEAVRLAQAKSDFLANMSHEIRTPLNAIIGLAAINSRNNQCESQKEYSLRIHEAGLHLLNVVNDVLDFSKIEAGKLSLALQPFRLRALIDEVRNLVALRVQEKQLNLIIEYPDDLPEWVLGDPLRLRQILLNLLSNAIKFTQLGFVRLTIHRKLNHTEISIIDSGIGMSPEQVNRLFIAFEQADTSTTRQFGGSGLGLAISRNLAHMMDGDIQVKSSLGLGSEFILTLPLPISPTIPAADQTNRHSNGGRLNGMHILAAEDVSLNRLVLEDLLNHEGAQVIFAENGQQVLDILAAEAYPKFDLVLMDVQMPVMDGYQATKLLLNQFPDLPVIGLTAHAMPEERQRCLDAGMRERITKPVDADQLVKSILKYASMQATADGDRLKPAFSEPHETEEPILEIEKQPVEVKQTLIDWVAMEQRFDGRQAFIEKLINNALDGSQQVTLDKLRLASEQLDFANIKFLAHSLKGLASVFEAQVLLAQAQQTEQAAKNQSDISRDLGNQLADTLQSLLTELQAHQSD